MMSRASRKARQSGRFQQLRLSGRFKMMRATPALSSRSRMSSGHSLSFAQVSDTASDMRSLRTVHFGLLVSAMLGADKAGGRQGAGAVSVLRLRQRMEVAHQALEALLQHMGIDLRGRDVGVSEQRLHPPQVGAVVQQMAREGVAEHMRAHLVGAQPG